MWVPAVTILELQRECVIKVRQGHTIQYMDSRRKWILESRVLFWNSRLPTPMVPFQEIYLSGLAKPLPKLPGG